MNKLEIKKDLRSLFVATSFTLLGFSCGVTITTNVKQSNDAKLTEETKSPNEIAKEYLDEYIKECSSLEEEIDKLKNQKEALKNNETFDIDDLCVVTPTDENQLDNKYILECSNTSGISDEYHNLFKAWINFHSDYPNDHRDYCAEYVHLTYDEVDLLFNYLTDEEREKINSSGGKITTNELDIIEERLRNEYQDEAEEAKNLTK